MQHKKMDFIAPLPLNDNALKKKKKPQFFIENFFVKNK